ncbi:hypothetical protein HMPREF9422_1833 [Streptococcus cristatus ATCC 51100]|jgi:hypothetical protein|nr:hypothetical protein HMPREF9422_1833 [Streptococcus cristatus ATCC 51100]RKV97425.1 MAG: hypothetical protein D8H99_22615 [Streptococcus sp.]
MSKSPSLDYVLLYIISRQKQVLFKKILKFYAFFLFLLKQSIGKFLCIFIYFHKHAENLINKNLFNILQGFLNRIIKNIGFFMLQ